MRQKRARYVNSPAKRRLQRAKWSEREVARSLLEVDGLPENEEIRKFLTSTGRVGDTRFGFDCASRSYITEVKSTTRKQKSKNPGIKVTVKILSQISEKAKEFGKGKDHWLLVLKLPGFEVHCISKSRHIELLKLEKGGKNE